MSEYSDVEKLDIKMKPGLFGVDSFTPRAGISEMLEKINELVEEVNRLSRSVDELLQGL